MNSLKNSLFIKQLVTIILPIAFQQFMMTLVNASDAFMLGMIDQSALSAVSLATQISFIYSLFIFAITTGESIMAAQYWGKKDYDSVEKVLAISLRASIVISVLIFCLTLLTPEMLMNIYTNDEVLISAGAEYLRIVSFSYLFCGVTQCYLCVMKNSGHASMSMVISSFMVVLNIFVNALLIFGIGPFPNMGIEGAAFATTLTRLIECAWIVVWMLSNQKHLQITLSGIVRYDIQMKKDYWKYALPVLGNQLVWGCGFTMYSVIMGHLGTDAVAANSISNIVRNLLSCLCIGLGSGGGIIVGNELGAGNLEKAKIYGGRLTRLSLICGIATGIAILLLMPLIMKLANLQDNAIDYLGWMLIICSANMIGRSINCTTIAGIFCAGGDTRFGFFCDTVTMWCVIVPLGLITAFLLKWPVPVVYLVICMDELIKLPIVYKQYKKYHWVNNLTNEKILSRKLT